MMECINLMIRVQNLYLVLSMKDKIHDGYLMLGILFSGLIAFIIMRGYLILRGDRPIFKQILTVIILMNIILIAYFAHDLWQNIKLKSETNREKDNKKIEVSYDNSKYSTDLAKFNIKNL